jgi:uncharacterized membrane protein YdcZ (DUF606 family)
VDRGLFLQGGAMGADHEVIVGGDALAVSIGVVNAEILVDDGLLVVGVLIDRHRILVAELVFGGPHFAVSVQT